MFLSIIFTTFIVVPILYILGSIIYQNVSYKFTTVKKIPGPTGYPVIGELLEIFYTAEQLFVNERKKALEYYSIYATPVLNSTYVNIIGPDDVGIVLSNKKNMKKGSAYRLLHPWLGTGLLTSEGSKWQKRRKMLTPVFHFSILQNFVDIFNFETTQLVKSLQNRCNTDLDINIIPVIAELTLRSIVETSMGKKIDMTKECQDYKQAVNNFGQLFYYRAIRPWLWSPTIYNLCKNGNIFKKTIKTLHNFSEKVINDKKRSYDYSYCVNKKLAMLDLILKAQFDGETIDDEGIREEVDAFIFAGYDTTATAICYTLLVLANHEEHQEKVYQEIFDVLGPGDKPPTFKQLHELPYLERCIKECLRLYPTVPLIGRSAVEDVELTNGYKIPAGASVCIKIYDIHHSPVLYPDPEKFDPDRFLPENMKEKNPYAYIPFGAGPRNCIGQRYAMLELKSVLCGVLKKFRLEPITRISDLIFSLHLGLKTTNEIHVKFVLRKK